MGVFKLPVRRTGDQVDAGPIGSLRRRFEITVSTIRYDRDRAAYLYGKEVPAELAMVSHDFLRDSPSGSRVVPFSRLEIRVAAGASPDIKARGTVFLSEMPAGQRRVHEALLQSYASSSAPRVFEEIEDLPSPWTDASARAKATDEEAIRALHHLRVNIFETGKRLVAGFVTSRAGAFMSYADQSSEDGAANRREANLRLAGATWSIGAVVNRDAVRDAIWQDKAVLRVFNLTRNGGFKVKGGPNSPEVEVPPEVGYRAADHLDIAIRQAMAGAGQNADEHVGKPVATYAKWLFERHLYTATVRLSGRLPPTVSLEPDHFENLGGGTRPDDDLDGEQGLER